MKKQMLYQTVLLLFLIFLLFNSTYSQQKQKIDRSVGVTASSPQSGFTEVQQQILDFCNKEIKLHKFPMADYPYWLILTNALQVSDDLVVISVTSLCALPSEIIDHCAKDALVNTFFLKDKKDLAEEGRFVREWTASEFISQFYQIRGTRMYSVKSSEIQKTCKEIVENFRDY